MVPMAYFNTGAEFDVYECLVLTVLMLEVGAVLPDLICLHVWLKILHAKDCLSFTKSGLKFWNEKINRYVKDIHVV